MMLCFRADGAEYESQGQARAQRIASPLDQFLENHMSPERAKYNVE